MSDSYTNKNTLYSSENNETRYLDAGGKQDAYMSYVVKAAAKGVAAGAAVILPLQYLAAKRYPGYARVPLPGKVFISMMTIIPVGTVFAEKAGERYIASTQWSGVGKWELDKEAQIAKNRWEQMSSVDKMKDWASRHQYGIIGTSWVASMGIAFGIVARDRYQTFPQKLVQARMWAQGLTVGVLLVSAVMAGVDAKGKKPERAPDHSWQDILEQGGNLTRAERIRLHSAAKSVGGAAPAAAAE